LTSESYEASRAKKAIRDMIANGWTDKAMLIDHAAQVLGGNDQSQAIAAAVWARHFEIHQAN